MMILGVLFSLCNYLLAKFSQNWLLAIWPQFSYTLALIIPWIGFGFLLNLAAGMNGLKLNFPLVLRNKRGLILISTWILAGLGLFSILGITQYFHAVKYPLIFYLYTPIAEELIFRGFIYRLIERGGQHSPVFISALLFGLHHLQYFNFSLTRFAIFQVAYTFVLGLLLGKMRKLSGNIYPGLMAHVVINFVSVRY